MKKKKSNLVFYSLFFLASLLGEMYCLLAFLDDIISVGGMGIVVLIAAYLFIDSIRSEILENHKRVEQENQRRQEELIRQEKRLCMAMNKNIEEQFKKLMLEIEKK